MVDNDDSPAATSLLFALDTCVDTPMRTRLYSTVDVTPLAMVLVCRKLGLFYLLLTCVKYCFYLVVSLVKDYRDAFVFVSIEIKIPKQCLMCVLELVVFMSTSFAICQTVQ